MVEFKNLPLNTEYWFLKLNTADIEISHIGSNSYLGGINDEVWMVPWCKDPCEKWNCKSIEYDEKRIIVMLKNKENDNFLSYNQEEDVVSFKRCIKELKNEQKDVKNNDNDNDNEIKSEEDDEEKQSKKMRENEVDNADNYDPECLWEIYVCRAEHVKDNGFSSLYFNIKPY
eukprot:TRINITY_DN183_c2_g1_i1.p1 TRINITY_DN183_c2_g1~~TRINITY_DN183_c2_g1_i1.p1  ORF type:complete len:172 (-),score=48.57 TRINITY_DN183_c2_g1_i1:35-550(-)